jgi:hypothetical protein
MQRFSCHFSPHIRISTISMPHKTTFTVLNMEHKIDVTLNMLIRNFEINRFQSISYSQY